LRFALIFGLAFFTMPLAHTPGPDPDDFYVWISWIKFDRKAFPIFGIVSFLSLAF